MYIVSKGEDKSTFKSGATIPQELNEGFTENLSINLSKGDKHKIKLIYEGKDYDAKIYWVDN